MKTKTTQSSKSSEVSQPQKRGSLAGEIPVCPAFRPFPAPSELDGISPLRKAGLCVELLPFAPNASDEIVELYVAAMATPGRPVDSAWFCCKNQNSEIVHREPYVCPTPEQALRDLYRVATLATGILEALGEARPELCRELAGDKQVWPLLANQTHKDWQRHHASLVKVLGLGRDVEGLALSARTGDENVIRGWAAAIYRTLLSTRWEYQEARNKPSTYLTTEGCPDWAHKTLKLPPFIKANARQWAKLGEEMLLQQCPDFLNAPMLARKKDSWQRRARKKSRSDGEPSKRAVQRQAFDDFAKEIQKLAPEKNLWVDRGS